MITYHTIDHSRKRLVDGMSPVSSRDIYLVKGTQYRRTTQQQYKHKRSIV